MTRLDGVEQRGRCELAGARKEKMMSDLPYHYPQGYPQPLPPQQLRNGWGIAALVLGISGSSVGLVTSLLAFVAPRIQQLLDLTFSTLSGLFAVLGGLQLVLGGLAVVLGIFALLQKGRVKRAAAAGLALGGTLLLGYLATLTGQFLLVPGMLL